jgi:hypothetical protein
MLKLFCEHFAEEWFPASEHACSVEMLSCWQFEVAVPSAACSFQSQEVGYNQQLVVWRFSSVAPPWYAGALPAMARDTWCTCQLLLPAAINKPV